MGRHPQAQPGQSSRGGGRHSHEPLGEHSSGGGAGGEAGPLLSMRCQEHVGTRVSAAYRDVQSPASQAETQVKPQSRDSVERLWMCRTEWVQHKWKVVRDSGGERTDRHEVCTQPRAQTAGACPRGSERPQASGPQPLRASSQACQSASLRLKRRAACTVRDRQHESNRAGGCVIWRDATGRHV